MNKKFAAAGLILALGAILAAPVSYAGMTFGVRDNPRANFSGEAMNRLNVESACTNAISRYESVYISGLNCRLSGSTMNVYLALSDEALRQIAQDPNAIANLATVRQNFLTHACKRDSMLLNSSYTTVKYYLVDKYRNEIANYAIHRADCR